MKKTTIASALILTLLLAGCSNGSNDDQQSSENSQTTASVAEESSAADTTSAEQTSAPDETSQTVPGTVDTAEAQSGEASDVEFALYGPGGDRIAQSEITRIEASDEEDYKANGISADNWIQAEISGFTYLAEPGGEYKRYNVGDEICGLTVFDAGCVFSAVNTDSSGKYGNECYFSSGYAEFRGSKTVSGTLSILAEDTGILEAGSVIFTPDSGAELPVMNYIFSGETGVTYPQETVYPYIALTDVTVENNGEHATLTMDNITVSSMVNGSSVMRASASDVTID